MSVPYPTGFGVFDWVTPMWPGTGADIYHESILDWNVPILTPEDPSTFSTWPATVYNNPEYVVPPGSVWDPVPFFFPDPNEQERCESPPEAGTSHDPTLRIQHPRFKGDLYTAPWVQGKGPRRSGWCRYCSTWRCLKDSSYWYHIHYTHGISCTTGLPFPPPGSMRRSQLCNDWEIFCANCNVWISAGGHNCRTAYFRHAYKCYFQEGRRTQEGRGKRKV